MQSFRITRDLYRDLWRQWPAGEERATAEALSARPEGQDALHRLITAHYGLHLDPRRGSDVPAAFATQVVEPGEVEGPWTMNCLVCHGGAVEGRFVPGLANSSLMLESFVSDIVAAMQGGSAARASGQDEEPSLPMARQGHTVGLTEATLFGDVLLRFREPNLDLKDIPGMVRAGAQTMSQIASLPEGLLALDAPAWWQLQHKTHLYLDHSAEKNHRTVMQFTLGVEDPDFEPRTRAAVMAGDRAELLDIMGRPATEEVLRIREGFVLGEERPGTVEQQAAFMRQLTQAVPSMPLLAQLSLGRHLRPTGISGETIRSWDDEFREIFAFIEDLEAPRYPGVIDEALAGEGQQIYRRTCARCHGHHDGSGPAYRSARIAHDVIGTDALYPTALDQTFRDRLVGFLTQRPDGTQVDIATDEVADEGYVAPPLNGVWATAPYLHNGSIPTVDQLLDYEGRMERVDTGVYAWTAEPDSYDHESMGLAARFLDRREADSRRYDYRVHDARRRGASAVGHDFGEALKPSERRAVIEYLKKL